jgi:hypothetical protein
MFNMRNPEKKKERTVKLIVGALIIFVMVGSTLGYFADKQSSSETNDYNGYSFKIANNKWATKINKTQLDFDFHPREVDILPSDPESIQRIKDSEAIFLTYDPKSPYLEGITNSIYILETYNNQVFNKITVVGLTDATGYELKKITCINATPTTPVIFFNGSSQTSIIMKGDCIIVNSPSNRDFIRLTDKILYEMLGIIKK